MSYRSGRHFLQIPGPTNVPERVLRAMARPTIDHRGPEFAALALELLEGIKEVFRTSGKVVIFPSSGSGAWEAAMVNTLSPGDKVLMFETGQFAFLWQDMAGKLGLDVHADSIVVVRILDHSAPQPAQRFSWAKFREWLKT